MNAFGCLDNVAWILVYEKDIKNSDGTELNPKDVASEKRWSEEIDQRFQAYVDSKHKWFSNLIEFRDSLAHRIPLYIPPYVVPKANIDKYDELEKAKGETPQKAIQLSTKKSRPRS